MASELHSIADQAEGALQELVRSGGVRPGQIVVLGVSTSEVRGERIGSSGAEAIAEQIHEGIERVRQQAGVHIVWQCCEHLNRALVTERRLAEAQGWTEVSAVPVPKAGGSMAAYAYRQMEEPCLVEAVQVHAGIDIGETLIGMHLRPVAVPLRPAIRSVGQARVNMAATRPRLIGGARAVYEATREDRNHSDTQNCD
ncbi:TIGR01440 family protein [Cohnella boryungensis]|uniref:UPF0340 protein ACFO1S_08695 n=1 Tax=Cohnella boryungensis TaxID=768479 RepID=A0ABV8S8S4_9BACL